MPWSPATGSYAPSTGWAGLGLPKESLPLWIGVALGVVSGHVPDDDK